MGCNHRKPHLLVCGYYPRRKQPQVVQGDMLRVFVCRACGAIRIDSHNEYSYAEGGWSDRNGNNKEVLPNA